MHQLSWVGEIPTIELKSLFELCNNRYFNNALTPSEGFCLKFSRSSKLFGCFRYCLESHTDWGIEISYRLRDHPLALLSTMVHEMIHMLAHQNFRESGDPYWLDEKPVSGKAFVNPGHGAFFLAELERLNKSFDELGIAVKTQFGDATLYDLSKIKPERLLVVNIDRQQGKGMVYRLHNKAELDWERLRATSVRVHGTDDIAVLKVRGHLAEGFPSLRRDNGSRVNMKPLSLRGFSKTMATLRKAAGSVELRELPGLSPIRSSHASVVLAS